MLVTDEGMVIEVRDEHPINVFSRMLVTDEGIVIEVRDEHTIKAP